jgi:two-component SAPR family response regulator
VDAPAFEALAREPTPTARQKGISLYRGAFLASEQDAPWAVPRREKLRAEFVEAVARQGAELERSGDLVAAAECYACGLEADDLVESFYQGLIRCYAALDRQNAAIDAYRRCRQILSARLGEQPCSATERLFQSLRTG